MFGGAAYCYGGACSGVPRRGKAVRRCPESTVLVVRELGGGLSRAGCSLMVTPGGNEVLDPGVTFQGLSRLEYQAFAKIQNSFFSCNTFAPYYD